MVEMTIFGAVVSALVQWMKQSAFFSTQWHTLALVIVLSLIGAFGYTYLVSAGYWQSFLGIITIAGAIYSYIFATIQKATI